MKITTKQTFLPTALIAVALLCVSGCGGEKKPDGFPKLVNATFTLTQDNVPLADATVKLYGKDITDSKWSIFGASDATGVVHLATHKDAFKGIPVGEYKVTVVKDEITPSKVQTPPGNLSGAQLAELQKERMREYRPCYHLVSEAFGSDETTELTLSVSASGATPDKLELGPAVREEYIPYGTAPAPDMTVEEVQDSQAE